MFPFIRLAVWHRAHGLATSLFSDLRPGDEPRAAIIARQIWRAASSIPANIAEGAGSGSHAQFARYLGVAIASAHELQSHLLLARDAGCLDAAACVRHGAELEELKRMMWALRARVRADPRGRHGGIPLS